MCCSPCCSSLLAKCSVQAFYSQNREGLVTLSAAKGLSRRAERSFAALRMTLFRVTTTGPILLGKFIIMSVPTSVLLRHPMLVGPFDRIRLLYQDVFGHCLVRDRLL